MEIQVQRQKWGYILDITGLYRDFNGIIMGLYWDNMGKWDYIGIELIEPLNHALSGFRSLN